MFNLNRGGIIESALEIVEKMRELKPDESGFVGVLDAGYKMTRRSFRRGGARIRSVTDATIVPLWDAAEYGDDDDISKDVSDMWLESVEAN